MKSLREVGLGLSVVFGCLLLALVAELYYLLWWKKRVIINRGDVELGSFFNNISSNDSFCCKKIPFSFRSEALNPLELCSSDTQVHEPQQAHNFWNNKPFGGGEESVESELFRLQNFPGPPRFLFTIKEETKEDLESEDSKSRGGGGGRKGSRSSKSLSDFFHVLETPYLTPIASPKFYTPPLTPIKSPHDGVGYSSFDSSSEAEFNFLVSSSPPPKFQFLKDAEEKLYRNKLLVRNQENVETTAAAAATSSSCSSSSSSTMFASSKHEENDYHHFLLSNSSQILPLECKNVGS